jgi:hypothetical protein
MHHIPVQANVAQIPLGFNSRTLLYSEGVTNLPDQLVLKQAYPIMGESQEGPLFSKLFGQFGIADVLAFCSCQPEEPHGSTDAFFQNAIYWDVFGAGDYTPERRGLQCIAFPASGQPLLDLGEDGGIPSPGDLLETILHAIIGKQYFLQFFFLLTITDLGHCNLFINGILHRDVSVGNILRYSEPISRPPLKM